MKKTKFYVYQLIDPRNNKVFYVGKGCNHRMYRHVKEVQQGRTPNGSNVYLKRKIKKILNSGLEIKYKKVFITENEQYAFTREIELIQEIGLENLCNLTSGGDGFKHSEETKQKMSNSHKGRTAWNKGKSHSKESIQI